MDNAVAAGPNAASRSTVPVLPVSSVTGKGLDILRWFLFLVPPTTTPARLEQVIFFSDFILCALKIN